MANKLIDLDGLQQFKNKADEKYYSNDNTPNRNAHKFATTTGNISLTKGQTVEIGVFFDDSFDFKKTLPTGLCVGGTCDAYGIIVSYNNYSSTKSVTVYVIKTVSNLHGNSAMYIYF